jgi:hypothetical protein
VQSPGSLSEVRNIRDVDHSANNANAYRST